MSNHVLKKHRAQSSQNVHLPYIANTLPLRSEARNPKKQFDLRVVHAPASSYDPLNDKNLKSFFAKSTVKKHLQHLPPPRSSSKTTITESSRDNINIENEKPREVKLVSKENFVKYLEEVRKRIQSGHS